MKAIRATARVQLIVELLMDQPWGEECSIGQLYKEAKDSARKSLINTFKPSSVACGSVAIIGDPKIIGIITEEGA